VPLFITVKAQMYQSIKRKATFICGFILMGNKYFGALQLHAKLHAPKMATFKKWDYNN
jgi:hypothetical protein